MPVIAPIIVGLIAGALAFHPARPLYMTHRNLEVVSADGVRLAATLAMPRWIRDPVPGVVVVHGSGRLSREHVRGDVRRLVREGFGVLAYDKRGVGMSGGEFPTAWGEAADSVLGVLADDAAASLDALRGQRGVDPERAGFFGASQASSIIPLAAERAARRPRFQVILSGAAVSTGVEALYSSLTGDGVRTPQLTDTVEIMRAVRDFTGDDGFDPAPLLAHSDIPTLWLLGDRDQSVPTSASTLVLDSLRRAGSRSHTVIRYAGMGHDLRHAASGEPAPIWDDIHVWVRSIGIVPTR